MSTAPPFDGDAAVTLFRDAAAACTAFANALQACADASPDGSAAATAYGAAAEDAVNASATLLNAAAGIVLADVQTALGDLQALTKTMRAKAAAIAHDETKLRVAISLAGACLSLATSLAPPVDIAKAGAALASARSALAG